MADSGRRFRDQAHRKQPRWDVLTFLVCMAVVLFLVVVVGVPMDGLP